MRYGLVLILRQKMRGFLPSLISLFNISHSIDFTLPHGLNLDNPTHVVRQVVIEAIATVVANRDSFFLIPSLVSTAAVLQVCKVLSHCLPTNYLYYF